MEKCIYLALVDIIFACCYNHRIFQGDDSVESPWLICKLSATLSCFELFANLHQVITCAVRRSLIYPLYRHMDLSKKVLTDTVIIFKLGKKSLLKTLLHCKDLLEHSENCYIFDRIWLSDLCVWIQSVPEEPIKSLASELHRFCLRESDLELDLTLVQPE